MTEARPSAGQDYGKVELRGRRTFGALSRPIPCTGLTAIGAFISDALYRLHHSVEEFDLQLFVVSEKS